MDIKTIQNIVNKVAPEYPIRKATLFGSRANGTNREDSDIDLIIEFSTPVSLLTLSEIKLRLEGILKLKVDIVHGPLRADDILEIDKTIEIYSRPTQL